VAKRSVRKARARAAQREAHPRSDERVRARGFWLGALTSAAVLVPLAVIAVLLVSGDDQDPAASTPRSAGADRETDELRGEFAARDKEQIEALTTRTRAMVEEFSPVIVGLARTLPPDTRRTGPLADAAAVDDWRRRVREADAYFAETVSGETATNVARNGFANAVDVLLETVEIYRLAVEQPAVRATLLERARDQRDLAARTWSTAAIQLDAINIEAGFGHQHVTFPSSAGPDAAPPDTLPEGTDAETPGNR
jgi:hypothetical protein